jgi:hypothetical protein
MLERNLQKIRTKKSARGRHFFVAAFLFAGFMVSVFSILQPASAQQTLVPVQIRQQQQPTIFRVGEKLTYNVSFNKYDNAAYAEIYSVSRGRLGEKDAVELRLKIKTLDLLSSAFYAVDQGGTTFASAETGLPLYVRKTSNTDVLQKNTVYNYLVNPASANDFLTLLYQIRNAGGVGAFAFQEDDKNYSIVLQNTIGERVKSGAGEFDTNVSTVESQYFTERGITNLRVNFSVDERRVPILIRFKTAKGDFRAELASLQTIEPETAPEATPKSIAALPPPQKTPTPAPTLTPYIDNQPLSADLPFALGETLEYQVSQLGRYFGNVTLQAKERRQFNGQDSLLLTVTATETQAGNPLFNLNDNIRAQVNPDSLAPQQTELRFSGGANRSYNQVVQFDQKNGFANLNGGANRASVPIGTHSLLSLAYALRSFNLKPSKDPNNPVNDTRVAVFLGAQAYVFTLRPSANAEFITLKNEKIPAQLVSVSTGNASIDQLGIRLWLGTDEKRLPLRLIVGNYQADLISETRNTPK